MRHAPPAPREHADASDDPGLPPAAPPSGDEARYRALFAATYDAVLRYVERRHHPLGAEDVVADVFLVAWRRLKDVPVPHDEARAWLCGVAQHTLANQRRGDARRLSLQVRVGEHLPSLLETEGHDTAQRATDRVDLQRAWSRLSPTDQEALTLIGLDGLTSPQAAAVIGISTTAFSVRLFRARRRLQTQLDRRGGTR